MVATTYPLERIVEAQTEFLEKRHVGKYVLLPPPAWTARYSASSLTSRTGARAASAAASSGIACAAISAASPPGSARPRATGRVVPAERRPP